MTIRRPTTAIRRGLARLLASALLLIPTATPCAEDSELDPVIELLGEIDDAELQLELLAGLEDALGGRAKVKLPVPWPATFAKLSKSSSRRVREKALALALIFDDPAAIEALRKTLLDRSAPNATRRSALDALAQKRVAGLAPILQSLLGEKQLRRPALRALARFDDASTPAAILESYESFDDAAKQDAVTTLASRTDYALALLTAMRDGTVERGDIHAVHARQLASLGSAMVTRLLEEIWGKVRKTRAESRKLIAEFRDFLTDSFRAKASLANGRRLFEKTCGKCHKLYGEGGEIGPELTGSNRADLEYILENILDPGAAIGKDYELTTTLTRSGRVVSGIIKERDAGRITIQTENERVTLAREEVLQILESETSMMPDGLVKELSREEVRDLISYLATKEQVPLLPAEE